MPAQRRWRNGARTDLALSFLNPLIVWPINVYLIVALINALIAAMGWETHAAMRDAWASRSHWLQLAAALLVADFASYWKHRIFHMRWLWPIHAVHHAADEIDWLTNERDHPLQLAGTYFFVLIGLALAGFSSEMIATQAFIRRAYSLYTHANVGWDHGPLRRLLVSPGMHRWHHASDAVAAGRNFATMFSFYDVAFGTYAAPVGQPREFGVPGEPVPTGLLAAMAMPVRTYARLAFPAPVAAVGGADAATSRIATG